ncbi:MAG: LamG domain-containing protein [Candidatus Aminicenantes bacterium]|nr:MAG: LamG domain-containing protein [Candidatus Aminicenantes bacterium]
MKTKNSAYSSFFSIVALGLLLAGCIFLIDAFGNEQDLVSWWKFEHSREGKTLDSIGQIEDDITGNFKHVPGVQGNALKLDGFTTVVTREASKSPRLSGAFSIEAWIAIAAYPWNWCPVVAQEKEGEAGYFFGIGPQGEVGFHAAVNREWKNCISEARIPLRKWTHVCAVYDTDSGIKLYVNGEISGELLVKGRITPAFDRDLLIGMNREKKKPSHAVPPGAGTLPSWFSLDGILDEVKIFKRELSPFEVINSYSVKQPSAFPDIPPRVMPSGPPGPGRFGAYYTRLRYYEEWDALWPVSDHPDVIVQFDDSPVRVVFWRGLRYSPAWITENGLWLADQSGESGNDEGCVEHMQDIHCLYSHVRIIENTPARAVVHWRYAPVSSRNNLWTVEDRTGWAWWIDEYYTFYPDGTGIRKVLWRQPESGHELPWLQIQETSVLCHPGQNAGDVLKHEALTLLNLEGFSHTYSWPDDETVDTRERRNLPRDPSIVRDLRPDNPVIQVINMRAKAKPFVIFEPGNRPVVYVGRVRSKVINFPAYNHWPVCQVHSDGRFVQAADRATSFSISYNQPRRHLGAGSNRWVVMFYGATLGGASELLPLAKSWIRPPELKVVQGDASSSGYDISQRAYIVHCVPESHPAMMELEFLASSESPLVNACLVVKGWEEYGTEVLLEGRRLIPGRDFRIGTVRVIDGTDLLLWLKKTSTIPVRMILTKKID